MKKYLNKDIITINITHEHYEFALNLIKKYKEKYDKKIQLYLNNEEKSLKEYNLTQEKKTIKNQKYIIVKVLKDISNEFDIFKKYNVCILLTGSFARDTNKSTSDLDLHILYKNKYKKRLFMYEELYYYVISKIINISRNQIHAVITTRLSERNKKNVCSNMNSNCLTVLLKYSQDECIEYSFYPNTKKRFFLQYINSKTLGLFEKYLKNEIKNKNREWAHNFLVIRNETAFENMYKKTLSFEKKVITKKQIEKNIDDLINKMQDIKEEDLIISEIKKKYQQTAFSNIYNTLSIVRSILIHNGGKLDFFNIKEMSESREVRNILGEYNSIFNVIYKYLWRVKKLALYCNKSNIPYSIHTNEKIENIEQIIMLKNDLTSLYKSLSNLLTYVRRKTI